MDPNLVAAVWEGGVPIIGGLYATLLGFRVVGPKPGEDPQRDEWHAKHGKVLRILGPLVVAFGVFLLVQELFFHR